MRLRIADCGFAEQDPRSTIRNQESHVFDPQSAIREVMFSIRNSRVPIPNRIIRNLALSLTAAFTLACANVANPAKPAAENTPAPKADQGGEADKAKKTTAFDGERAFNHVKAQVEFGPRPAGSPANEKCAFARSCRSGVCGKPSRLSRMCRVRRSARPSIRNASGRPTSMPRRRAAPSTAASTSSNPEIGPGAGTSIHSSTDAYTRKHARCAKLPSTAIAPSNPDVVYALIEGTRSALFRSDDGGVTWRYAWRGVTPRYARPMCIDPRSPYALTVASASTLMTRNSANR